VLNGDPSVLDQTLVVNGHPLTIVGVAAQGFNGLQVGSTSDVIVPLMMKAQMTPTWNDLDNRRSRWLTIMGRLKPGITADGAEVQLNVVYTQIKVVYEGGRPPVPATFTASLVSYGDRLLATSEDGDTFVIKAGPTHEIMRTNSIGEPVYASLALAGDSIYIRGAQHLFAIRSDR
jgi:hypothetical protein